MANNYFSWEKIKASMPIIASLLSFFLGSGIVWNWMNLKLESERNEFETQKILMQEKRDSLEELNQRSVLNGRLTDRFFRFSKLTEDYITLLREYDKYDQTNKVKAGDLRQKMKANRSQSFVLLWEIEKLEHDIAKIENREPRDLDSEVPLLPPALLPPILKPH